MKYRRYILVDKNFIYGDTPEEVAADGFAGGVGPLQENTGFVDNEGKPIFVGDKVKWYWEDVARGWSGLLDNKKREIKKGCDGRYFFVSSTAGRAIYLDGGQILKVVGHVCV